jgi:hypothetical protein
MKDLDLCTDPDQRKMNTTHHRLYSGQLQLSTRKM